MKTEITAEILQIENGRLIIRARPGRKLTLTKYARTAAQADGSFVFAPIEQGIEMSDAMQILDVPYTTLRRLIEGEIIKAWKRTPARWTLDLASVLEHKAKAETDPEYWDRRRTVKVQVQKATKPNRYLKK